MNHETIFTTTKTVKMKTTVMKLILHDWCNHSSENTASRTPHSSSEGFLNPAFKYIQAGLRLQFGYRSR